MTDSTGYRRTEAPQASAAFGVKQALDVELETIRHSYHLNEEGKQTAIEEAYAGAVRRYEAEIEREEREATDRVVYEDEGEGAVADG